MASKEKDTLRPGLDRLVREGKSSRSAGSDNYSRFVKMMRIVLPLAAAGIFALLFAWPELDRKVKAVPRQVEVTSENITNELINPRFEGVDNRQRPFTITAARAVQSDDDPGQVNLELPVADITLSDGKWLAAEAEKGLYRQDSRSLELEGKVFLFYGQGYEITTEKLYVDLKGQEVWSESEVSGKGPKGHLQARSVRADAQNGTLYLEGPAKLVLYTKLSGL